jgi:hypothetical protein
LFGDCNERDELEAKLFVLARSVLVLVLEVILRAREKKRMKRTRDQRNDKEIKNFTSHS